jgi:hypothetical protein
VNMTVGRRVVHSNISVSVRAISHFARKEFSDVKQSATSHDKRDDG